MTSRSRSPPLVRPRRSPRTIISDLVLEGLTKMFPCVAEVRDDLEKSQKECARLEAEILEKEWECFDSDILLANTIEKASRRIGETTCPICTEPMKDNENIMVAECLHAIHETCQKKWLCRRKDSGCVVCRKEVMWITYKR